MRTVIRDGPFFANVPASTSSVPTSSFQSPESPHCSDEKPPYERDRATSPLVRQGGTLASRSTLPARDGTPIDSDKVVDQRRSVDAADLYPAEDLARPPQFTVSKVHIRKSLLAAIANAGRKGEFHVLEPTPEEAEEGGIVVGFYLKHKREDDVSAAQLLAVGRNLTRQGAETDAAEKVWKALSVYQHRWFGFALNET